MASARERSVFINCPFDGSYKPLFDAIMFAVLFCDFEIRSALEANDAGDLRLLKIVRLIGESRFSVHDLSRVELDQPSGLPRFNMPIELGIAIGARHLGDTRVRDHLLLVLDSERYRYQRFASDLAGIDIQAHGGEIDRVLAAIRDFLAPHVPEILPGASAIHESLQAFEATLPAIARSSRQRLDEITYLDRLHYIRTFLEELV